jgi:hypothetical protein
MAQPTDEIADPARPELDEDRKAAGPTILQLTDEMGFDAFSAAWLHDRPSKLWRYLLVTPLLETKGPLWVHERLLRVFRRCPLPAGITPLDIFVIAPATEDAVFGRRIIQFDVRQGTKLRAADGTAETLVLMAAQDIEIEGFSITDGFAAFYRRLPDADRKARRDPSRLFDRRVRQLEAA